MPLRVLHSCVSFCTKSFPFAFCNRTKTSKRCVSPQSRSISSMDTWWTGSWSRRTQPVPVQNCEVSWKGWSESPSGCLSAGCGVRLKPRLHPPKELHNQPTQNPAPVLSSWADTLFLPPEKACWHSLGVCWTPPMWLMQGWSASRKLRHHRERMMSEEYLVAWGDAADWQLSWPEAAEKTQIYCHLLESYVSRFGFNLLIDFRGRGTDEHS